MKRFENAEIGDRVWSELHNLYGIIKHTEYCSDHPIYVELRLENDKQYVLCFTLEGKEDEYHAKPSLFYLDANGNKCTERPEQPIDWENVKPGEMFEASDNGSEWRQVSFRFYAEERPWFYCGDPEGAWTCKHIRRIK